MGSSALNGTRIELDTKFRNDRVWSDCFWSFRLNLGTKHRHLSVRTGLAILWG